MCLGNIGGPPSINLIREIYLIISLISNRAISLVPLRILAFMGVAYTLILYASSQQGPKNRVISLILGPTTREISYMFTIAAVLLVSPLIIILI